MSRSKSSISPVYLVTFCWCALLAALAFLLEGSAALEGLVTICLTPDVLITDYVALAGPGGALLNSALVTAVSALLLLGAGAPVSGATVSTLGLMAGFSLFGKDILNIWPIVLGALLYARLRKEPLWKYLNIGLMATTLAPIVSALWFSDTLGALGWVLGTVVGLAIGLFLPLLAGYTGGILRGMNLYNVGFACGLTAMMIVPILASAGAAPSTVLIWAEGYNGLFTLLLVPPFLVSIAAGVILSGGPRPALAGYGKLLKATGSPSEFLNTYGAGAALINLGLMGLLATGYILLIGGDLNGPTVGAVLTLAGFAANGKHPRNSIPLIGGLALGAILLPGFSLTTPAIQFSALFCTTMAPLCGTFGWWAGILAGFLHGCLVQRTGWAVCGLNLYNNGFTGGTISIVLYPLLVLLLLRRTPADKEKDMEELSRLR